MSAGHRRGVVLAFAAAGVAAWAGGTTGSADAALEDRAHDLKERASRLVSLFDRGEAPLRIRAAIVTYDVQGRMSAEGNYVLEWAGSSLWRETIDLGVVVATRGVAGDRSWRLEPTAARSIRIRQIRDLLGPVLIEGVGPEGEVVRIKERDLDGTRAACVRVRWESAETESCYDTARGVLLREERRGHDATTRLRTESAHAPFREKLYPRVRGLSEDHRAAIEARDIEIADLAETAPARFEPPDRAEASAWCEGMRPPERVKRVFPEYPASARVSRRGGTVTLAVRVLHDGTVGDLWVVRSLSPDLDAAAAKAVGQWRYRPATCGDRPVPVDLVVDVSFSVH